MWLVTNVSKMTRVTSLLTNEWLLNEEFSWNPEDLTVDPVVGPPIHIDVEMLSPRRKLAKLLVPQE